MKVSLFVPSSSGRAWKLIIDSFLGHDGLSAVAVPPAAEGVLVPLAEARERFERDYILRALAAQQGNISRTADVLGVERSNLYQQRRAFGIAPSRD